MADPGTVFAIVTIALGAARGLYKFIESAADAPEQLKSVQNELQAVINVLADLRNLETELDEKGSDLPDTTKQAAQNCESACKIFERSLNEWTKTVDDGRLGTRSRLKLWRNKSKIEIFMKNMRTCKATLSVSLGVFNSAKLCRQTTDINKVKDILLHLAEEIEKEKEEEKVRVQELEKKLQVLASDAREEVPEHKEEQQTLLKMDGPFQDVFQELIEEARLAVQKTSLNRTGQLVTLNKVEQSDFAAVNVKPHIGSQTVSKNTIKGSRFLAMTGSEFDPASFFQQSEDRGFPGYGRTLDERRISPNV